MLSAMSKGDEGLAANGRAVDEIEVVDIRDTRELMDKVLLRNGRLASPSSRSSSKS